MEKISHPVSGEIGFFCSMPEKELIDVVLADFRNKHLVVTSRSVRGGFDE